MNKLFAAYENSNLICVGDSLPHLDHGIELWHRNNPKGYEPKITVFEMDYGIHPTWLNGEYWEKMQARAYPTLT